MRNTRSGIFLLLLCLPALAFAANEAVVHRDPGCPCCTKWAVQLREKLGRQVRVVDDAQRAAFKQRLGVPAALSSCHTTIIEGYVFEGHVPFEDVKRLLAQRPKNIRGLAVAGMPLGSPGMEVPGGTRQKYEVIAFGSGGQRVFARHN